MFEDVNIKFTPGNCYGLIGANGAGKSTFLKILSGEIEPSTGDILRQVSVLQLKQNHFEYERVPSIRNCNYGSYSSLQSNARENAIYMKEDFSDEDGMRAAERR